MEYKCSTPLRPWEVLQSALPFRVVGEAPPASSKHMEDLRQRCFKAASDGRWSLLAHILTEFPAVAQAQNEEGASAQMSGSFSGPSLSSLRSDSAAQNSCWTPKDTARYRTPSLDPFAGWEP